MSFVIWVVFTCLYIVCTGDTIVVGARNEDAAGSNAGAAYLYSVNGCV